MVCLKNKLNNSRKKSLLQIKVQKTKFLQSIFLPRWNTGASSFPRYKSPWKMSTETSFKHFVVTSLTAFNVQNGALGFHLDPRKQEVQWCKSELNGAGSVLPHRVSPSTQGEWRRCVTTPCHEDAKICSFMISFMTCFTLRWNLFTISNTNDCSLTPKCQKHFNRLLNFFKFWSKCNNLRSLKRSFFSVLSENRRCHR